MHNGKLYEEKTLNLGPKPITSSEKQVVQGDGRKPGRTPSLEEASRVATIAQCKIVVA
jgi:hypothetical protein